MHILRIGSLMFNYLENLKASGKFVLSIKWVIYTFLQSILEIFFNLTNIWRIALQVRRERKVGFHVKCPFLLSLFFKNLRGINLLFLLQRKQRERYSRSNSFPLLYTAMAFLVKCCNIDGDVAARSPHSSCILQQNQHLSGLSTAGTHPKQGTEIACEARLAAVLQNKRKAVAINKVKNGLPRRT